jgi:hypothetical protein
VDVVIAGGQFSGETPQVGDQHVRRLVRRVVTADGEPRHHVVVVAVDDSAEGLDVTREGGESKQDGQQLGRRVRVRVLVVKPRR